MRCLIVFVVNWVNSEFSSSPVFSSKWPKFWHLREVCGASCSFSHTDIHKVGCHSSCLVVGLWLLLCAPIIGDIGVTIWRLAVSSQLWWGVGRGLVMTARYFRTPHSDIQHHSRGQRHWASVLYHSWLDKRHHSLAASGSLLQKQALFYYSYTRDTAQCWEF